MAAVITNALYSCEWAPGYDWIVIADAWINSVSAEPPAKTVQVTLTLTLTHSLTHSLTQLNTHTLM